MAYDPSAIMERDRSWHYSAIWVGAAGAVFSAANLFIGMDNVLSAMAYGAMAGGPLSVAFSRRPDEYLTSLLRVGLRWLSAALGVYLMLYFWIARGDVANELGYWLADGETRYNASAFAQVATNGTNALMALALAFYAGFAFVWVRDRV
ncbi:MAG: hypothetical protein AAFQ34_00890, partial [Pseudomonadota bacterium]